MNKTIENNYERALQFMQNMSHKRPGPSNVYVFTVVDKDGNIVDEKYGMNLMTNHGFQSIYADGATFAPSNSVKLYTGTGVGTITLSSDPQIEIPAFGGLAATYATTNDEVWRIDGKAQDYEYPMYFSPGENIGEGLITLISRFLVAYYDYNIPNFSSDVPLTEYGIGTSANALWTHSHIFDIYGELASITKSNNERVYITVYMCLSFYESIIINGWSSNRFTMITQNNIMYDRMAWNSSTKVYKRGNRTIDVTAGGVQRTVTTSQDNVYTNSIIAPQLLLNNNNQDTYNSQSKILGSGYIDGFILSSDGFIVVEPQFLTTPENVELMNFWSDDPTVYTGFSDKFGKNPQSDYSANQFPQMTHVFDVSVKLFNYKSGDWDNEVDFYNPDGRWYDETPGQTLGGLPLHYSNNNVIMTGYVYQNIKPDDPILKITSGGVTVYATNRYWIKGAADNQNPDNGWVWIRDYENIPSACRSARYWITASNVDSLTFVRQSDVFQLLVKNTNSNGYEIYGYSEKYGCAPICDNYEYGWYRRGDTVYVPAIDASYTIGSASAEAMTYGKWMILFRDVNKVMTVSDMTDARTGNIATTDQTLPFTSNVNLLSATHRTESGTGIVCVEATNINEVVVIDLRQNSFTSTVHSWKHACCIWGTTKIAYISTTAGDNNVYIYNVATGSVEGNPIPFPSGISDIPHLFGHTNYVWMTDGSSFGYVCDIRTPTVRNPVAFAYGGLYGTGLQTVKYTCVDDVFIVYKTDENHNADIPKAHYIKLSDPTNPIAMTDFDADVSSYVGGRIDFILRYVNQYTNASSQPVATLVLLINRGISPSAWYHESGADSQVIDFGQYLWTGNVVRRFCTYGMDYGNLCLYGENAIFRYSKKAPLLNYLPIKFNCKTDTVNAMSHGKNITEKSWLLGYTNTPLWGDGTANPNGKPPGTPLAMTNGNGYITGWS